MRIMLRTATATVLIGGLIGLGLTPAAQAQTAARGSGTITTAPGIVADAQKVNVTFIAEAPASASFTGTNRAARETLAAVRFPARAVVRPGQYALNGALVLRNTETGQAVTLQDIVVDMPGRRVSVSVREFFGIRIDAFTITDPGKTSNTTRRTANGRTRTTTITGATLAVSQTVGNQVNQALGLSGSDAIFTPGFVLGTADLRITTRQ